ncbi:hypothetical protein P43SY_008843 [Pythium insidiosum]|uniref:Uncharacterized protein n=1 Tax=Pythium insidiosum TaxID=114742 RepID=A0AAD5LN47_PYTIN|nr:hypothetical protein P43SY_008843 [Pythium insidiosum]
MQRNAECSLCQRPRRAFFCARCTSDLLQQRRTMLAALQADVAVLRKKTEFALNSKSGLVDAERRLSVCMDRVEVMAERVMKTRERLCTERIELVERTSAFEKRSECVERAHDRLQQEQARASALHLPVLQCLDIQVAWTKDTAARVRGTKIREVFALFGLRVDSDSATSSSNTKFFRSIASLPLPISGRFEIVPPEVVAAALGKVIRLLTIVAKRSSEGKQVQTAFLLENSQTLDASAQILPEYSMVQ